MAVAAIRFFSRRGAVLLLALLGACGGGSAGDPVTYQSLFSAFEFRVFAEGTHVLRTQAELETFWASGSNWTGAFAPAQPAGQPSIDFSRTTVVGITLGVGARCYIPEVLSVTRSGDTLTVAWRTNRDRQITTSACHSSYPLGNFLAVPAWPGPVVFDYRRESTAAALP